MSYSNRQRNDSGNAITAFSHVSHVRTLSAYDPLDTLRARINNRRLTIDLVSLLFPLHAQQILVRANSLLGQTDGGNFVRLLCDGCVDLGVGIEGAVQHAPACHPLPCPRRLILGDGARLL
jgi:hypothetical protein